MMDDESFLHSRVGINGRDKGVMCCIFRCSSSEPTGATAKSSTSGTSPHRDASGYFRAARTLDVARRISDVQQEHNCKQDPDVNPADALSDDDESAAIKSA